MIFPRKQLLMINLLAFSLYSLPLIGIDGVKDTIKDKLYGDNRPAKAPYITICSNNTVTISNKVGAQVAGVASTGFGLAFTYACAQKLMTTDSFDQDYNNKVTAGAIIGLVWTAGSMYYLYRCGNNTEKN